MFRLFRTAVIETSDCFRGLERFIGTGSAHGQEIASYRQTQDKKISDP